MTNWEHQCIYAEDGACDMCEAIINCEHTDTAYEDVEWDDSHPDRRDSFIERVEFCVACEAVMEVVEQ